MRALLLFVLAVTPLACGKTSTSDEPPIAWMTRIEPACAKAKASKRPVLFFYAASWDMVTKELEHTTFTSGEVRALVNGGFVPLRVDRSEYYMNEDFDSPDNRESKAAEERFHPYASKGGSLIALAPDCTRELWRGQYVNPKELAPELRRVQRATM